MVHTTNIPIVKNGPNVTMNIKKSKYSKGLYYKLNPLKNLYILNHLINKIFYLGQHCFIELINLYELNINFRISVYCE